MTKTESEIFIVAVSDYGNCMSVTDVLKKYRDITLQEALEDNLVDITQYINLKTAKADVIKFLWR